MPIPSSKWRVACLFLSAAAIGLPQENSAVIAGRVTNSATGTPVLRAHVSVYSWSGSRQKYGALTDAEGKFSIARLAPGQYSISAEAAGFQSPQIAPDARTDSLVLRAAEHRGDVDMTLTPWGAISGRVIDAEGRPAQGVQVSALGLDGMTLAELSGPDGQYRLGSLPPGRYRVRAAPPPTYQIGRAHV